MTPGELGKSISYIHEVAEQRYLILFLPGVTGNIDQWKWVRESLKDIPADIAFGAAVLPRSIAQKDIPTVAEVSSAIATQLRGGYGGEIVVVSHSGGAFSALEIARELESSVKTVILVNGGLTSAARFMDRPIHQFIDQPMRCVTFLHLFLLISTPAPGWLKRVAANYRWLAKELAGKLVSSSALDSRELRMALANEVGGLKVLAALLKNRHHWRSLQSHASEVQADVIIAIGDADPVSTLEDAEALTSLLPRARIVVLEGVSHAGPLEDPRAVADIVREAVKS